MSTIDLSTWLTLAETMERLDMSERTVYRMRDEKKLRYRTRKTRGLRPVGVFNPDDVERYAPSEVELEVMPAEEEEEAAAPPGRSSAIAVRPQTNDVLAQLVTFLQNGVAAQAAVNAIAPPKMFLTIAEASLYIGLSESYLRRMVAAGELPAVRDRAYKVRKADLDAFAAGAGTWQAAGKAGKAGGR